MIFTSSESRRQHAVACRTARSPGPLMSSSSSSDSSPNMSPRPTSRAPDIPAPRGRYCINHPSMIDKMYQSLINY